jgi:hypothetical protein
MRKQKTIAYEVRSGNIFAALGLDDADELLTCAKLGHTVRITSRRRGERPPEVVFA